MRKLENRNPNSEKYKTKKASTLLNAKEFDKGKKNELLHLKMMYLVELPK